MADPSSWTPYCFSIIAQIYTRGMKYTNKQNNIKEILKVYIINSITKSYILNTAIKIRPLLTKYTLMIKLMDRTSSGHSFNPYAYFGHSWSYFDIQNLRLVILYIFVRFYMQVKSSSLVLTISDFCPQK
jgi:hypothetical protein